ncbi:transgelin-2-like [Clytia hemisphaerica]|uniref:Transgelin n=1 Tax=Clytia hemisphaerica TaxID=252671 RepID=A0A7M5UU43_9CNID|eukprot:TCONS_00063263-protein
MADRQDGYGFTAECQEIIQGKWNQDLADQAAAWISSYVPALAKASYSPADLQEKLKDGQILCALANAIVPESILRVNTNKMAFKQMENIGKFLAFCEEFGCLRTDLFQTVDLYEGVNMPTVVNGIIALGRKVSAKGGRGIGPKESAKNTRNFSEEQIRQGRDAQIGLQAGTNKFANQSGQNFGKTRAILD